MTQNKTKKSKHYGRVNRGSDHLPNKSSKMLQKSGSDKSYANTLRTFEGQKWIGEEDKQILNLFEDSFLETEYSGNSESSSVKEISYYKYYSPALKTQLCLRVDLIMLLLPL